MRKFYLPLYSGINARINSPAWRGLRWIAVAALLFVSTTSNATHLAGGELTYTWISGTTYEFTATFYRDCQGVYPQATMPMTYSASGCPGAGTHTATLTLVDSVEITFPCGAGQTYCNGGTNPGFKRYRYKGTVDIKKNCTNWVFSWTLSNRNVAITTIQNPGSDPMYIEATLNNSNFPTSSSPTFTNFPVAILCAGQPFTYNQGALDPNGDSLSYSFICPRTDASTCVTYNPGFNDSTPITSIPAVTLNKVSGNITMNPNTIQVGVATVLVKKYHNGVLVGSVLRDIEILIRACTNNLPTASGINGTAIFSDTVCAGSNVCFNVLSNDVDAGQIVTITWNNAIPGATFTSLGSPHPTGTFCWTPSAADARANPYTFTVTVQDNNCPTNGVQSYGFSIWVPPVAVSITPTNISCSGGTGSATAVGSGGVAPYTYSWSPTGQTTATATGLSAGINYTVTATDKNGCSKKDTVTLTSASTIAASLTDSIEVSCNGGSNGSATITATGGAGGYTHHWSNGQTTNPATGLSAGAYTDTVKDASGCIALVHVNITQPVTLIATITTQQNASCKGLANGTLAVTPAGGTGPYTYVWSPSGGTDSTATGLGANTYTVVITDAKGCTVTKTATITEPGTLVPLITAITVIGPNNITCAGATNGSVTVTVTGGTPTYSYLWSPGGSTDSTLTNLPADTFCVHVTDDNGCTADTCIVLTQPDSLKINITELDLSSFFGGYHISCHGENNGYVDTTYLVTGGTQPYHYSWSPGGETTKGIDSLIAGTYTLTVTDTNGCTASQAITLLEPDSISFSVSSQVNAGCKGDSSGSIKTLTSGGTGPYTYAWSTGDTTANVSGYPAGTYTVQVTDQNGCFKIMIVTITEPVTVVPMITAATVIGGNNIGCSGDTTGKAWVTVTGGTLPYTYLWSVNGATTDTVYNLGAGPITVMVTDSNGCRKLASDTIKQPEPLAWTDSLSSFLGNYNVGCSNSTNGYIRIAVDYRSGTPNYTYQWSPNVSTDSVVTGVGAGTYSVVITDANGCKDSASYTLTAPDTLKASITSVTTNGGWNISCFGAHDGEITVTASGGTQPYRYTWVPNVSNTSTATNLDTGKYIITVTDTNGCSYTDSIRLFQPQPLSDSLTAQIYKGGWNVSCYGYADGCITDSVWGGTAPYSYQWSTGKTTDTLKTLCLIPAGTYSVTITDANGCTVVHAITLTQPDSINPNVVFDTIGIYNIQCHGGTACIHLSPSGGTAGYTYYWTPGELTDSVFCDTAGTYHVLITDTNGCVSNRDYTLTQPDTVAAAAIVLSNYGGSNISCDSACNGTITITMSGGVRPFQYTWVPNVSTDSVAKNLCAGSYTITVTDSNGCSIVLFKSLTEPQPLTDSLILSDHAGLPVSCAGNDGSITVSPSGGTRPYHYTWSPVSFPDSVASGLGAGTYTVTVTDSNGCSVTDTVTLTAPVVLIPNATVSSYNGRGISCIGDTNGYIHVTVTGGVLPYTHHWSTGNPADTTANLDSIGVGIYTDTITDQQGCKITITRTITGPQLLSLTAIDSVYNGRGVKCNGDANGYIHIVASGGTPLYTYTWNPSSASTDSIADSLGVGLYSYTVTDVNGCVASGSQTITGPQPFNLSVIDSSYNGSGVKCSGVDSSGYIHLIASGGTPLYTYTWNPSSASSDSIASKLVAGVYSYTVTDANGCSASGSTTITAPTPVTAPTDTSAYGNYGVRCNGDSSGWIHLTVSGGKPAYTYQWSYNGATTQNLDSIPAGVYSYTVTDKNGCTARGSATLTQKPSIGATADVASRDVCGDNAKLIANTPAAGDTGTWSVVSGSGIFLPDTHNPNASVNQLSSGVNILMWTVTDGYCPASDTVAVTAYDRVSSAGGKGYDVCPDSMIYGQLNADRPQPGTGVWVSLGASTLVDPSDPNTHFKNLVTGLDTFVWVVTNGPCSAVDTVIINLKTEVDCFTGLEMPTGFTPNHDGQNDEFDIHGLNIYPNNTLTIFNRWGNEVFFADDYINKSWHGQNKSGEDLPDGTYFAILVIKNSEIKLHGYVDIRR